MEAKLILPALAKKSANENANEKEAKKAQVTRKRPLFALISIEHILYTYMTFGHRLYDTYSGMFWNRKGE
jgi:hypothetical protein